MILMGKRILLMYISEYSGHHQASIALEKAILAKDPASCVLNVNAFRYASPITEKVINELYMKIIKRRPEIWGYLYDNPKVIKKTKRLKSFVYNRGSKKIGRLIKQFRPDVIGCTQAYPCVLAAEYKKTHKNNMPVVGILTDYAPHTYWIHESVDAYIVPSTETGDTFIKKGVPSEKIKPLGIPIDPLFEAPLNKSAIRKKFGLLPKLPAVLVMGGSQGIGPNEKLIKALDGSSTGFQVIMITGVNKKLSKKIENAKTLFRKKLILMGFTDKIHELMEISDIIITKPGGLTTAEALKKTLPMIILNPLPGQESFNTTALTGKGVALKARDERDAVKLVEKLLNNPDRIKKMKNAIRADSKPRSATDAAELLLRLAG